MKLTIENAGRACFALLLALGGGLVFALLYAAMEYGGR